MTTPLVLRNMYAKGRAVVYGQELYCPECDELEGMLADHKTLGAGDREHTEAIRKLKKSHPRCKGCGIMIGPGHLSPGPIYCNNCAEIKECLVINPGYLVDKVY